MQEREHGIYRDDQNGCLPCCSAEGQYPPVGYSVESVGTGPTSKTTSINNNHMQQDDAWVWHEMKGGRLMWLPFLKLKLIWIKIQISLQTRYFQIPFLIDSTWCSGNLVLACKMMVCWVAGCSWSWFGQNIWGGIQMDFKFQIYIIS